MHIYICDRSHRDASWIGGLTKVVIYPPALFTLKGCGACHSDTGPEGHKVVS